MQGFQATRNLFCPAMNFSHFFIYFSYLCEETYRWENRPSKEMIYICMYITDDLLRIFRDHWRSVRYFYEFLQGSSKPFTGIFKTFSKFGDFYGIFEAFSPFIILFRSFWNFFQCLDGTFRAALRMFSESKSSFRKFLRI